MKNYDADRRIYTATGKIVKIETSLSSASSGGSITLYHLLIAIIGVEEPELLYLYATTYAKPHLPLPFLQENQKVTLQYKEIEHSTYDCLAIDKTTVTGKSYDLLFLELDWDSLPYMETAKTIAAESEMPTPI